MPTRRQFVSQTGLTAAALAMRTGRESSTRAQPASTAGKPLNVLILGGTGFIGPNFVRAAVNRGHKVAVFNRGKSHTELPPTVERLVGDRNSDLRSIQNRTWDCVIDLSTYGPQWVRTLGEALKERAKHYTFISTIDVYEHRSGNPNGTDEQSDTFEYHINLDPYSHTLDEIARVAIKQDCEKVYSPEACSRMSEQYGAAQYGALKVLCEREAEKQFPGRTLVARPGYMVGPGDPQARFTYWVARMENGGEVLAPGDPLQPVQFIDVRDVAEWVTTMAERAETGIYNALGPGKSMSMCEMLGGVRSIFGTPMKLTWVSIPWIRNQDIVDPETAEWDIWRFSRDDACKSDKAIAKGLRYRPLSTTARDTLDWYKSLATSNQPSWPAGLTEIMQREKEILAHWRVHQSRF